MLNINNNLKKKLCVTLITFFLSFALFAKDSVDCEGQFLSEEGDGAELIKRELITSAYKNAITKTLSELSLDSNLFWEKYSEKFQKYIVEIKSLTEPSENTDDVNSETAKDSIKTQISSIERKEMLDLENDFINSKESLYLFRMLNSYKEKIKTRSSKNPFVRYIKLEAFINKIELKKIYNLYVRPFESRKIQKIYLFSNLNLKNLEYSELSINSVDYFVEFLTSKWKDKIKYALNNSDISVELINSENKTNIENYIHSSNDIVDDKYSNALFIEIGISIEKTKFDSVLGKTDLSIYGSLFLYDIFGKRSLTSFVYPTETHSFIKTSSESQDLSNLASVIHQLPLSSFNKLSNLIDQIPQKPNLAKIEISGHKNLNDIYALIEELILKVPDLMTPPELKTISTHHVSIFLNFNGETSGLENSLKNLDNTKVKNLFRITFPQKNNPYLISIKDERNDEPKPTASDQSNTSDGI